jgi:hypothetical protein
LSENPQKTSPEAASKAGDSVDIKDVTLIYKSKSSEVVALAGRR